MSPPPPPFLDAIVSRETRDRLEAFVALLIAENERQNLIAASTIPGIWVRHIVDGLQLAPLAPRAGAWLDIGSGAGLPGLVVAIVRPDAPMTLIEPRARRATFLEEAAKNLGLTNVSVVAAKAEAAHPSPAAVISARAVARLDALLAIGQRHAGPDTVWLLPKGRSAAEELAITRRTWQGSFRLIPSLTDPEASIIMVRDVRRKAGR
ncbi:16S rRNA (guanine(527)-N(7))-methyltransferase RsmG [Sphingomonas quercus]|uniref:Ribosomal RNA small subunit methyltransferase G n=1 Tax=Sphingomonas quercus TaxID=2842451 RepID=A0ABS6BF49_9SPHN|nr:16S rRNA (guanine(527)-N(7))-methyltransferase RsmG [Sphingomonas quercus]MBU3076935.1 16S rRNA (guanine(527)-N(7))-methyltransferase RsmG [Sphingomonas quercus]